MSFPVPRQIDAKGEDARALIDLWSRVAELYELLNGVAIVHGRLVGPVTLAAGVPLAVSHGLGRPFQGWFPVRLSYPGATAVVQEASSTLPSSTLRIQCAVACTLSLWVF